MFRSCISSSPFTTNAANTMFSPIAGNDYGGDISFLATLRALLPSRMGDDSLTLDIWTTSNRIREEDDGKQAVSTLLGSMFADFGERTQSFRFYLVGITGSKESNAILFSRIKEHFEAVNTDTEWSRVDKISALYRKAFEVLCFVSPKIKTTFMFVDNLDYRKFHYLQCCIPGAIPWYFDESHRVTEQEFSLIDSLRQHTDEKYLSCLDEMAKQYDFRSAEIKSQLTGFEEKYEYAQLESVKSNIASLDSKINDYMRKVASFYKERDSYTTTLYGLETKIEKSGGASELMEYFLCNKNLYLTSVSGTTLTFAVKTELRYYDEELAETTIDNRNSFIYRELPRSFASKSQIEKLLRAIFIDEILKINICASFNVDLIRGMTPNSGAYFDDNFRDCMANPHVQNYGCMGNYVKIINELFAKRDYIGMIEQCVASAQNVNWGDSVVMSRFMNILYGEDGNNRCIVLPNGKVVETREAIEWLEAHEKESACAAEEQ